MGYIGNEPAEKYSALIQQTFSSPTGTSFTLSQSVTTSTDIALFVDNVRQDPATYTAVGTALTTSTISSPSTMYCLYNGRTTETISPATASVDSSHIVSGAVDDSHISGLAASKLTGSLPASMNEITKSSSDPTVSTNPAGGVGTLYLNTTSGEMFSLTDATGGANVWTNLGDGTGNVDPYVAATGGTITTDGSYKVHTFTSSGTFAVSSVGVFDYLVIAGGGSGAATVYGPGGGGAGGYRNSFNSETSGGGGSSETSITASIQSYTVTIGAGGAAVSSVTALGNAGSNSVFGSITSAGGGYGSGSNGTTGTGGSGGGGDGEYSKAGGAGTSNQGYAGGTGGGRGAGSTENYQGGGGGGAGAVGGTGIADGTNNDGYGGVGLASSITGSSVVRAGGGGGAVYNTANGMSAGGLGGTGGGGTGGLASVGANGTVNTGSGGGGGSSNASGAGGSGVVIIRYQFQA